jgi:hypothetical protein
LYPLPDTKNATEILDQILNTPQYSDFRPLYANPYLFSKSLTEHILVDHVVKNKATNVPLFPIAIMRLSPVGPSVQEPLIGWVKYKKHVSLEKKEVLIFLFCYYC